MQVIALGNRGPLITDKGREPARLVVMICCINDPFPDIAVDTRAGRVLFDEHRGNLISGETVDQIKRGPRRSLAALRKTSSPFLAFRNSHNISRSSLDVSGDPHHVGVF